MSQKDKLKEKFLSNPRDFTFQDLIVLLSHFGYYQLKGGKTGGSRVTFSNGNSDFIRLHKPHPNNILKEYQIKKLTKDLNNRGLL
jgi:hypothetical protein